MPRELQKEKLFNLYCLLVTRLAYTLTAYFCVAATGCFVKALPMGRFDKSYTKQLGQIIASGSNCLARYSQFKVNKKQKQ